MIDSDGPQALYRVRAVGNNGTLIGGNGLGVSRVSYCRGRSRLPRSGQSFATVDA
ncbi:MAG TPA: hypothetical protein VMV92_15900 [Streptosporangiaceae bacterium]|nr:hypothetical protein [Streptosporangiaceae bacterium]